MDMHAEHHYPASPATVFAMLTDEGFLRRKLESLGNSDVDVRVERDGSLTRVRAARTVEVPVPGFAKRVLSPRNTVIQTDEWEAERDGVREGRWTVETKGVPVTMDGSYRLCATGTESVVIVDGRLKVSVPLIGGRLERFAGEQAEEQLSAEHQFGVQWLTARG